MAAILDFFPEYLAHCEISKLARALHVINNFSQSEVGIYHDLIVFRFVRLIKEDDLRRHLWFERHV
jgi:hypothetical protein